ncbi:MAG TPA: flagellar hook-associated protein FlgL [Syntrophales bacterium]|nr:flagellar hook-associated protein FlgL [Syntrophales bacterium]
MITRVSDNMKFDLLNNSMSGIQLQYNDLMEKLSTQKQVNRPSDDPLGMGKILDYRSALAQITNYKGNIDSSKSWLSSVESNLSHVSDILTSIKSTAISQASATASASTRQIAADSLQPLIDEIRSLANTKFGNRYFFSGTRTDTEPFSETASAVSRIDTPVAATGNTFDGTVTSGGAYTGTANKTYAVKIITGGTLAASTYQISADGGKTWGAVQTNLSAPVTIGDGIQLTFTAGATNPVSNDIFYVHAYAPGYYNGNGEELSSEVSNGVTINYSITGEEVFTNQGKGTVDIFKVLDDLKTALVNNDANGITSQLDLLDQAGAQISRYVGQCGTRTNGLDASSSALDDMNTRLTSLKSNIEDADVAKLATEFQMKQLALEATYKMAGDLGSMSIIGFLK